jgi:hypothetical protein
MKPDPPIEFIKISVSDPTRLIVLKSKYNRFGARFNLVRLTGNESEQNELTAHLTYLKSQIDMYD